MPDVHWDFYPRVAQHEHARKWIDVLAKLQKAPKTIDAYARGLNDFLAFCARADISPVEANRGDVASYVHDLHTRAGPLLGDNARSARAGSGLASNTIQQRLTVARLWYDFLAHMQVRGDPHNPVGRGSYHAYPRGHGQHERGLVRRQEQQPWLPTDDEWDRFLAVVLREEPLRNQAMVLLAYDLALRRSELVALRLSDIDWPDDKVTLRPETTKTGRGRVVFYGEVTRDLLVAYVRQRQQVLVPATGGAAGPLFLSTSNRNAGQPLTSDMWNKIVESIRARAGLPQFKTHTFRHLRLTDLARCQLELYEIAQFAGHASLQTTQLYINLHPVELAQRVRAATSFLDTQMRQRIEEVQRTNGTAREHGGAAEDRLELPD